MKYYTGIGSRAVPENIFLRMAKLATALQDDYCLRSGGAPGSDWAWESGVTNNNKEIYLPWKGFNNNISNLFIITNEAMEIASNFHPSWKSCSTAAKKLHARNVFQVLGFSLKIPSEFLICWTPDYCNSHKTRTRNTGGTGQAISIADHYNIPIINMNRPYWEQEFLEIFDILF